MTWTDAAASLGAQAATTGLKAARKHMGKRRYRRLVATAVAQMLELLPGVSRRKARRRARRATGARPSKKLAQAVKQVRAREGAKGAFAAVGAAGVAQVVGTVAGKISEKLTPARSARMEGGSQRRTRRGQRQVAPESGPEA